MRKSALLMVLAACGRAENAERLQELLSRTPIPLDRLRDALEIKPGEVEILGGDAPKLYDPSAPSPWAVMNRGTRPLWLHRDDLTVRASVEPLLSPREIPSVEVGFARRRPEFKASDWILLMPLEQAPLRIPDPGAWGRVEWIARIGEAGPSLYADAAGFNAKQRKDAPEDWPVARVSILGETTHLPPFSWDGNVAGRAPVALALRPAGEGELVWDAEYAGSGDRPVALALWAYVLSDDRRLLYQGRLDPVSHRSGEGRLSTRYAIPFELPSGTHQLLVLGQYAGEYLRPGDEPRRGISRWIPFSADKK